MNIKRIASPLIPLAIIVGYALWILMQPTVDYEATEHKIRTEEAAEMQNFLDNSDGQEEELRILNAELDAIKKAHDQHLLEAK